MASNAYDIRSGMDVIASDGQKIGTVGDVFSGAPPSAATGKTPVTDVGGGQPNAPVGADSTGAGSDTDESNIAGGTQVQRFPVTNNLGTMNTGTETTGFPQGAPGGIGAAPFAAAGLGGDEGETVFTPSDTKYFEVKHGGFLGFGGDAFYVPFSAIASVAPGDNLTLACSGQECSDLYSEKPQPLGAESTEPN